MNKGIKHVEYFFDTKTICKFCNEKFSSKAHKSKLQEHIKKYHGDEMGFEDHIKAHKDGKCGCSGVDITL